MTILPRVPLEAVELESNKTDGFDLEDFCEGNGLGEAAKLVCDLVASRVDVPPTSRRGKAVLKKILMEEHDWTEAKVDKVFGRITKALKSTCFFRLQRMKLSK